MLLGPSRVGGAGSLLLLRLTQQGEAADPGGVHRSGRESPANEAAQGSSDKGPTGNWAALKHYCRLTQPRLPARKTPGPPSWSGASVKYFSMSRASLWGGGWSRAHGKLQDMKPLGQRIELQVASLFESCPPGHRCRAQENRGALWNKEDLLHLHSTARPHLSVTSQKHRDWEIPSQCPFCDNENKTNRHRHLESSENLRMIYTRWCSRPRWEVGGWWYQPHLGAERHVLSVCNVFRVRGQQGAFGGKVGTLAWL